VQNIVSGHHIEDLVNEISRNNPTQAAAIISAGKPIALERGEIEKVAEIDPWINGSQWREDPIGIPCQ
jgi:hypothetical protein